MLVKRTASMVISWEELTELCETMMTKIGHVDINPVTLGDMIPATMMALKLRTNISPNGLRFSITNDVAVDACFFKRVNELDHMDIAVKHFINTIDVDAEGRTTKLILPWN